MTVSSSNGVYVWSKIPIDNLKVTVVEGQKEYNEEVTREAESSWKSAVEKKPHLFDGPVWALKGLHQSVDSWEILLQSSSYKFVLYSHWMNPDLPFESRTNALGCCSICVSSDGFFPVGLRSSEVGICPNMFHLVPAGNVDRTDVKDLTLTELEEELGVKVKCLSSPPIVEALGLIDTGRQQGHRPELILSLHVDLTSSDIHLLFEKAADHEHERIEWVPHSRRGIVEWLGRDEPTTEVTKKALSLYAESLVYFCRSSQVIRVELFQRHKTHLPGIEPGPFMSEVPSPLVSLVSGGVAGVAVDVSLFPLDSLKTRLQAREGFWRAGGVRNLYRGLFVTAIGSSPSAAVFFLTYTQAKAGLYELSPSSPLSSFYLPALAASAGEVAACGVRVPVEVVKQRYQTGRYSGSLKNNFLRLFQEEGVRGLYRGYGATVMREIPFAFVQFPLFEFFMRKVAENSEKKDRKGPSPGPPLSGLIGACCGSVAGAIAAAMTCPLDVAKTRIMLRTRKDEKANLNTYKEVKKILREEGGKALFKGVMPRVFWISVGGFVFFGAYETSKNFLIDAKNFY